MLDRDDDHAPADEAGVTEDASTEDELWDDFDADEAEAADASADEADEDAGDDFGDTTNEAPPDDDDAADDQATGKDGEATKPLTFEQLQEQAQKLEQQLRSEKGRAAGQQRRADRMAQEVADLRKKLEAAPAAQASRKQLADKIAEAEKEYGDVIGPLAEAVRDMQSRMDTLTEGEKRRLRDAEGQLNEALEAEWQIVLDTHPDGFEVIAQNQEAFRAWIEDQPKMYRELAKQNLQDVYNGAGAALLVSRFKMALAEAEGRGPNPNTPQNSRRQRQLQGGRTVRGSGRQSLTSSEPPDHASEEAYWKWFDKQGL